MNILIISLVILIIIILFIALQSFILRQIFNNISNLTQSIDNINNTLINQNKQHKQPKYKDTVYYYDIKDVPKYLQINDFNLRTIAKQCDSDTLDLADPKYEVIGKYVTGTYIEGNCDGNDTIRHIKNIDKVNFRFCVDLSVLFTYFDNLETIEGLDKIDISSARNLSSMFSFCHSLKSIDISFWDLRFQNIDYMFYNCDSLETLIISSESIDSFNRRYDEIFGEAKPFIVAKM